MSPPSTILLALVLCLSQLLHAQNEVLPRPSISVEPGPVIPWGQPVTIVCQGPAMVDIFRLERKGTSFSDMRNTRHETQARFLIKTTEDFAGLYRCLYHTGSTWSKYSEELQLKVTRESEMHGEDSNSPGLSTEHVSILTGVSVALFLCVLLLALIFLYCQHRKKHRPPSCKGEEQRPQERVSPAIDIVERTPDLATVNRLPEKDGEMHTPTSTAGGPPDVTYAQLDHQILTQGPAQAASPRSMEPTAEFSTYAALARRGLQAQLASAP